MKSACKMLHVCFSALFLMVNLATAANNTLSQVSPFENDYPLATQEEDINIQMSCFNGITTEKAEEILDVSKAQKYYSMQTYYILRSKGFNGADKQLQRFLAEEIDRAVLIYLQLIGKVSFAVEWKITANTYFGHHMNDMPEELQKHWQDLYKHGICIDIPNSHSYSTDAPPPIVYREGYPYAAQEEDNQVQLNCFEGITSEEADNVLVFSKAQKYYSLQTYYILKKKGFSKANEYLNLWNNVDCAVLIYLRIINVLNHRGSSVYGQTGDQMPKKLLNHWKQLYKKGVPVLIITEKSRKAE